MKSEKLYDGITNIRDDLIEGAQIAGKRKPGHKKWWRGAVAAALAVILIGGAALLPGKQTGIPTVQALAEARYPQMAPYPKEEDYWLDNGDFDTEGFNDAYGAWQKDLQLQHREKGYAHGLEQFFARSAPQILMDSQETNPIYSPLNVYMALSMLAEVTDGTSRQQILELLGTQDMEALRTQASDVWNAAYRKDGAVSCVLANSVWLRDDTEYVQSTLDTLADTYYASSYQGVMGSDSFNKALQDWLNAQTEGLLREQAQEIRLSSASTLALASTVYFQSKWSSEFDPDQTAPGIFHTPDGEQTMDFMHKEEGGTYYWDDGFGAISQPLESGGTMWFILPQEGLSPQELLSRESMMELVLHPQQWTNQKEVTICASIPKFDVASQMDLCKNLQKLGVDQVFDPETADFSSIMKNPDRGCLSAVQHDARVTIDEEGVTAAAYTVMLREGADIPPEEKIDFVADRPFLFVITSGDNLPLFIGVVNCPGKSA